MRLVLFVLLLGSLVGCGGGGGSVGSGGTFAVQFVDGGSLTTMQYGVRHRIRLLKNGAPASTGVLNAFSDGNVVTENLGGGIWGITHTSPSQCHGGIKGQEFPGGPVVGWFGTQSEKGPVFRFRLDATPPYPVNELEDRPFRFKLDHGILFLPFWVSNPQTFELPMNATHIFLPARPGFTQVDVGGNIYALPADVPIPPQAPGTTFVMTVTYQ